jgi:ADP-ribosylation factor GTPase-activating protein 2/3
MGDKLVLQDSVELKAIFKKLKAGPGNKTCFDCAAKNPTWASSTYGVFICIDCASMHRSYGVHLTFVRSTELDDWKESELENMRAGGNQKAQEFFRKHGISDEAKPLDKYESQAASLYRNALAKEVKALHGTPFLQTVAAAPKSAPIDPQASFFVSAFEHEQETISEGPAASPAPAASPGLAASPASDSLFPASGVASSPASPDVFRSVSAPAKKGGKRLGATRVVEASPTDFGAIYQAKEESDRKEQEKRDRAAAEAAALAASAPPVSSFVDTGSPKERTPPASATNLDWMDRSKSAISATGQGLVAIGPKTATAPVRKTSSVSSSSSESATSRFANAKGISSEQFHKTEPTAAERADNSLRVSQFEGQRAISSEMWNSPSGGAGGGLSGQSFGPSSSSQPAVSDDDFASKLVGQAKEDLSTLTYALSTGSAKLASMASTYLNRYNDG